MSVEQPFQNQTFNEIEDTYDLEIFEEGESSPYVGKTQDRVLQSMSNKKIPSLSYAPLFLKPFEEPLNAEKRVENTLKITEAQETLPYSFPELIHHKNRELETEYIPGQTLPEYIQNKPKEQVYELIEEIGRKNRQLHEENWAIRDLNPANIKVDETLNEPEIYVIDAEYATNPCDSLDKFYDHTSFADGIKSLENDTEEILQRYREGYELSERYQRLTDIALSINSLVK